MCGVKFVSRHEEALAGGDSFAQQGGLIEGQNETCGAISPPCGAKRTNYC